jgi:outer membrane beta-barrel protein
MKTATAKGLALFAIVISLLGTSLANAQQQQNQKSGSDKLDLKKLEDKYWAAKDTDMNVVQNRTYAKDSRFFLSLGYGTLVNDAYSYGRMPNGSLGYYFSERFGLELAYEKGNLADNDSTLYLKNTYQAAPNYNKFVDYKSINLIWVPFYSKTSFLDRSIMYFDIQFGLGFGSMTYETQTDSVDTKNLHPLAPEKKSAFGYNIDVTQQLFFSEHFALRLDIKNKWSKQELKRYQIKVNEDESTRSFGQITQQDTTILLGITYFFGSKGQ